MKKLLVGSLLLFVGLISAIETWAYWDVLTKWGILMMGALIGGCLSSGLLVSLWRPAHPATRYRANLPSPWDRRGWR